MECSDLLLVGKKTLNINIFVECGGCRCKGEKWYWNETWLRNVAKTGEARSSEKASQINVPG
jgi:hypothetical protein